MRYINAFQHQLLGRFECLVVDPGGATRTRRARTAAARSMPAAGTDVCWEDKVWLQHFPLSRQTVLDYFSNSPVSPA